MNYENIKKELSKIHPDAKVNRYVNYLMFLEVETDKNKKIVNWWFNDVKEHQFIDVYIKVAIDGLSIDGETITLQYRKKLIISYNYQAYKNKVLLIYPESIFDMQLVHKGDSFSFRKESGKVIYSHEIKEPFKRDKEIIGTYCIVKNSRGEVLETLEMEEVAKMKNTSKMKGIWDAWFGEMVLKSVIKRACKRHFRDITTNMDNLDNEGYEPENVTIDSLIQTKISEVKTFDELGTLYHKEEGNVKDKVRFTQLLGDRREELKAALPEITEADHEEAIEMLKSGKRPSQLLFKWRIDKDTQELLISKAV
jgi:hypothetical protein